MVHEYELRHICFFSSKNTLNNFQQLIDILFLDPRKENKQVFLNL